MIVGDYSCDLLVTYNCFAFRNKQNKGKQNISGKCKSGRIAGTTHCKNGWITVFETKYASVEKVFESNKFSEVLKTTNQ